MKSLVAVVAMWLIVASTASSQNLNVAYLEGRVLLSTSASWTELATGDSIFPDSTLKLENDSYVELQYVGAKIILGHAGTYSIRKLLSSSRSLSAAGTDKSLSSFLAYLLTGPANMQSTVSGARGEKSKSQESEWIENNAEVFVEAGKSFMASGQYEKAVEQFTEAMAVAAGHESAEARFYLAYSYALTGCTREALKLAAGLEANGSEEWTPDLVLLTAKLLVDTSAFSQAERWLNERGSELSRDAKRAPAYFFLLGLSYRGNNKPAEEKQSLLKAISMAPNSDLGKTAVKLLQSP